jgi:flagellar biosynthesis/type III secretory pathway protein FliH
MSNDYSDLTGKIIHSKKGMDLSGSAAMTTQVFEKGGLKKMLNNAHINGYREGFDDGYNIGLEEGLNAKVERLVAAALARRQIISFDEEQ